MNTELPEGAPIIGLDLAKKSFVGCMLTGEGFVKQQIFKGTMKRDETGWGLLKQKIKPDDLVFMEAGTASFTLARYLKAQTAARVEVLNPGMLRIIWMSQKKNDKADSIKLACIGRDMVEEAWPTISVPTEEEQAERSSITSYVFNKKQETQVVNRLYAVFNSLGFPEIKKSELRDNAKARRDVADRLLEEYPKAYHEVQLLLDGLDLIQLQISVRLDNLREICLDHPKQALSWLSIPGIGLINTATLTAFVGDGSRFSNPHQLLNFAGLVPKQDQSGPVDRHLGIHKHGNSAIRRNIVQGAWIASKMQPNCPITKYGYRKRLNGKSKQNVAIAVANKMLRTGLALLHSGKLYSPMIAHDYERLETKLRGYKLEALMNSLPQE